MDIPITKSGTPIRARDDQEQVVNLGGAREETLGPVGPIDELLLTEPLPGLGTD